MISEARAPGPHEFGPNRDPSSEIDAFVENFSFVGINPSDGTPYVISVRTERDAVFLSASDEGRETIRFSAGTRVVNVDPTSGQAIVADVIYPPVRHRKGLIHAYVVEGITTEEPYVSHAGQDEFEPTAAYTFTASPEGYIKIYEPNLVGGWDGHTAKRLMQSGYMDSRQWLECSVAHKVDIALQMYRIVTPDSLKDEGAS